MSKREIFSDIHVSKLQKTAMYIKLCKLHIRGYMQVTSMLYVHNPF